MFVDACAIISIITDETTSKAYEAALSEADAPFTSPLAAFEAVIILRRPDKLSCSLALANEAVVRWLAANRVEIREPRSPLDVLGHAISAAETHGLGKRALSNFDCFHYAHAKAAGVPMLTLDGLLRATDIEARP